MSRNIVHRRDFLQLTGLSGISLLPSIQLLSRFFQAPVNPTTRLVNYAFRLQQWQSLLNLEFYFVNVQKSGNQIIARYGESESYMIVRLPQQHIAEQNLDLSGTTGSACTFDDLAAPDKKFIAVTRIAGYSFLAFKLLTSSQQPVVRVQLTASDLLNWNDSKRFRLAVKEDPDQSLFRVVHNEMPENDYPLSFRYNNISNYDYDYDRFPKYRQQPVTALEFPWRLVLTPVLPDSGLFDFHWEFSRPPRKIGQQVVCPLWQARLTLKRKQESEAAADNSALLPELGLKILGVAPFPDSDAPFTRALPAGMPGKPGILPDYQDLLKLEELHIQYKLLAHTPHITFSPLGVSSFIHFKNEKIQQTSGAEAVNDLYSWKQLISLGRDEEVEVVHLILDKETGLKMLHIKSSRRLTKGGSSYLDYREYIKPLDPEIDYTAFIQNRDGVFKYNTPFKKIRFASMDAKRICPLPRNETEAGVPSGVYKDQIDIIFLKGTQPGNSSAACYYPKTAGSGNTSKDLTFACIGTDMHGREVRFEKKVQAIQMGAAPLMRVAENRRRVENFFGATKLYAIEQLRSEADKHYHTLLAEFEAVIKSNEVSKKQYDNAVANLALLESVKFQILDLPSYPLLQQAEEAAQVLVRIESLGISDPLFPVMKSQMVELRKTIQGIQDITELIISGADSQVKFLTDFAALNNTNATLALKNARERISDQLNIIKSRALHYHKAFEGDRRQIFDDLERLIRELPAEVNNTQKGQLLNAARQVRAGSDRIMTLYSTQAQQITDLFSKFAELRKKYATLASDQVQHYFDTAYGQFDNLQKLTLGGIKEVRHAAIQKFAQTLYSLKTEEAHIRNKIRLAKQEVGFALKEAQTEVEQQVSKFEAEFIVLAGSLKNTIDGQLDFFDPYAAFPQLQHAQVYMKRINELAGTEIPVSIKMASQYLQEQVSDAVFTAENNMAKVFAEVTRESKLHVKGAVRAMAQRAGGIMTPEFPLDYITYLKNDSRKAIEEIKNTPELQEAKAVWEGVKDFKNDILFLSKEAEQTWKEVKAFDGKSFFKNLGAKILGDIDLTDILDDNIVPPSVTIKNNKAVYQFTTTKIKSLELGIFNFKNVEPQSKRQSTLSFIVEKDVLKPDFKSNLRLDNFSVGVFYDSLIISFSGVQFINSKPGSRTTRVAINTVTFNDKLQFLAALAEKFKLPGNGLSVNLTASSILINYGLAIPSIEGGAFTFSNLKFNVGLLVPLPTRENAGPVVTVLGINSVADKFLLSVGIFGGRGHFTLTTTPTRIQTIDCSLEFGGYFGINLGIAKGQVFLFAGIHYRYQWAPGNSQIYFAGYLICSGGVTVYGYISVNVTFVMGLHYTKQGGNALLVGRASVSYSVRVGFFKKSFTLRYEKTFKGTKSAQKQSGSRLQEEGGSSRLLRGPAAGPTPQEDVFIQPPVGKKTLTSIYSKQDWADYCNSFQWN